MKLHNAFLVNGQPILGTYVASGVEELALCKEIGMNVVIGGHTELDVTTPEGAFCQQNGIKVMHHLVQHIYGAIQEYSGIDQPDWLDGPHREQPRR